MIELALKKEKPPYRRVWWFGGNEWHYIISFIKQKQL
jgi:hypothetical protein